MAKAISVFVIIGASFGPICGAMLVDYLLSGQKWSGPRAGYNPAGWIAWAAGFVVGILPNLGVNVPAAPVLAFIVGAVVYFLCATMGMQSPVVPVSGARADFRDKNKTTVSSAVVLTGSLARGSLAIDVKEASGKLEWNESGLTGMVQADLGSAGRLNARLTSPDPARAGLPDRGESVFPRITLRRPSSSRGSLNLFP